MPRELQPCGTEAAYHRHLKHDEDPCDACRKAHSRYTVTWKRGAIPSRRPAKCGTNSGYITHRRRRETACESCKAAHATYNRDRSRQQAYASWAERAS